jgi:hypothetical protein
MTGRRTRLLGALALAVLLGACSSADPVLYTIAPVDGAARTAARKIVVLERVQVARYLDRLQIVQSSENYRLNVKSNDWWGEPLSAMLRRILQQELGQRLPRSTILSESGAVTVSADATIDLDLQRLDEDTATNVVIEAQASIAFKDDKVPVLRSFRFSVPSTPGATGEVAAISTAVGQLADGLAAMLAAR